jgi:hypothetical protein
MGLRLDDQHPAIVDRRVPAVVRGGLADAHAQRFVRITLDRLDGDGDTDSTNNVSKDEYAIIGVVIEGALVTDVEGSSDVVLTEEQDRINEKRILDELVLAGTSYEDRKNILKIEDSRNRAIRYIGLTPKNPLFVGDPENFQKLSKFARPSARLRPSRASKGRMRFTANPGQLIREDQHSNVFKNNEVGAGINGEFPFHSIYSNMNYPSLSDRKMVF